MRPICTAYAHERLSAIDGLRIFGGARDKGPIVVVRHGRRLTRTTLRRSSIEAGIAVRAGTHCAMPLLAKFGVTSTCRASFALYNTRDEIDRLAEALVRARRLFS